MYRYRSILYLFVFVLSIGATGCSEIRWKGVDWERVVSEVVKSKHDKECSEGKADCHSNDLR
jgi:hypothetical protein